VKAVDLALHIVDGILVSEWDRYDLPVRLAEASKHSPRWKINVVPCCWDGLPLLVVRGRRRKMNGLAEDAQNRVPAEGCLKWAYFLKRRENDENA